MHRSYVVASCALPAPLIVVFTRSDAFRAFVRQHSLAAALTSEAPLVGTAAAHVIVPSATYADGLRLLAGITHTGSVSPETPGTIPAVDTGSQSLASDWVCGAYAHPFGTVGVTSTSG